MEAKKVEIKSSEDIVTARQAGREMARTLGFSSADQTRLATAISELTRNVIQYASTGLCTIADKSDESTIKIMAAVEDAGPGGDESTLGSRVLVRQCLRPSGFGTME